MQTQKLAHFLEQALRLTESCPTVPWYSVGCLVVAPDGHTKLSTGFTGERSYAPGKLLHAEEVAILKARESGQSLVGATLFSTMEPCSQRSSSKKPCAQLILDSGITCVVYGVKEPLDAELQIHCQGEKLLREGGLEVIQLKEYEQACLESVLSKRS